MLLSGDALEIVLNGLMSRYKERVPDVPAVIDTMIAEGIIAAGDDIENDHIAFRTMGVEHLGIASLEKIFLHYGYTKRDNYHFPEKNWTNTGMPRLTPVIPASL